MADDKDPMDWVKLAGVLAFAVLLIAVMGAGIGPDWLHALTPDALKP